MDRGVRGELIGPAGGLGVIRERRVGVLCGFLV